MDRADWEARWEQFLRSTAGGDTPIVERWYRQKLALTRFSWYCKEELDDEDVRSIAKIAAGVLRRDYGCSPYGVNRLSKSELAAKRKYTVEIEEPPEAKQQSIKSDVDGKVWTLTAKGRIHTLEDLLEAASVDQKRWTVSTWRANAYEAQRSGGGVLQLWQVKATLVEKPEWMWKPAVPRKRYTPPVPSSMTSTLVIPDSQNGYRWRRDMQCLEPLHDRLAWDIACQIAERGQPKRIVLLGDMVDFAEGSKRWPVSPDLKLTTQPTIEELHWWLARLRESCPNSQIVYIEGNHENRIDRALQKLTPELSGLRSAGDSNALLTWRRLLALDDLGIEYVGPYANDVRFTMFPDCEASHGHTVRQGGGATVASILRGAHISQVCGHIHRREYAARTIHGPTGSRTIFACSPGTICRTDGIVPHAGGRVDWQQGVAWLDYVAGATRCSLVPIEKGVCVWQGMVIVGEDHGDTIASDTNWPQLA